MRAPELTVAEWYCIRRALEAREKHFFELQHRRTLNDAEKAAAQKASVEAGALLAVLTKCGIVEP